MPSAFSHIAVPIATRIGIGKDNLPTKLLLLGIVLSVLPDADVLLLRLGIPYESEFGHRGASHSLLFCVHRGNDLHDHIRAGVHSHPLLVLALLVRLRRIAPSPRYMHERRTWRRNPVAVQ